MQCKSPKYSEVAFFFSSKNHNIQTHMLPAVQPEVSFSVTRGGPKLSAPQGRALAAGEESHLHPLLPPPLLSSAGDQRAESGR